MDDLVQFLRDRLDEDERLARLALDQTGDNWRAYYKQIVAANPRFGEDPADANTSEVAEHIARHDPARVLREIDAKRQVIEQYESIGNPPPSEIGPELSRAELGRVLRLLTLPYTDRPGYQEAWRP